MHGGRVDIQHLEPRKRGVPWCASRSIAQVLARNWLWYPVAVGRYLQFDAPMVCSTVVVLGVHLFKHVVFQDVEVTVEVSQWTADSDII